MKVLHSCRTACVGAVLGGFFLLGIGQIEGAREGVHKGGAGPAAQLDIARIEELTRIKGTFVEGEGVFRVASPRSDLRITVAGVKMNPALGLTSWAAFKPAGSEIMVMGDMVLLEDQVTPVMKVALESGLEVTALHNHFLWDSPKVMFMHVAGLGELDRLASAAGRVFAEIQETSGGMGVSPRSDLDPAVSTLDPRKIEAIFGVKGTLSQGVYKLTIGRTIEMHGHQAGNAMGVNTWAAFAGSDERAVVDGDFAMYESELQPVLKTLTRAGIHIVAIHNHMTHEMPRVIFLHFWGVASTESLAKGIKAALEAQNKTK